MINSEIKTAKQTINDEYRMPLDGNLSIPEEYAPRSGSMIHIYGHTNTGKTILVYKMIRAAHHDGFHAFVIPTKSPSAYAGLADISGTFIITTPHIEAAFDSINAILDTNTKSIFVIDDVSLMRSEKEKTWHEMNNMQYMTTLSKLARMVRMKLAYTGSILVITSQMRTQISTGRQVTQFEFLNDLCDLIYELRITEKSTNSQTIGIKCTNKLDGITDTVFHSITQGS